MALEQLSKRSDAYEVDAESREAPVKGAEQDDHAMVSFLDFLVFGVLEALGAMVSTLKLHRLPRSHRYTVASQQSW